MSRITGIFDMIFFLDNFDVNFLHRLYVNRFVSSLILLLLLFIFVSDSIFHVIL